MKLKEKILQNKYVVMLKEFFGNKWVKFTLATIVYVLWFVVWTGNLWLLPGIIVIYDLYISKFLALCIFVQKHQSSYFHIQELPEI